MGAVPWSIMLIVLGAIMSLMLHKAWCARASVGSFIHEFSPRDMKHSLKSPKLGFLVPKQRFWRQSPFCDDDTEDDMIETERIALVSDAEKRLFTDED